MSNYNIIRHSKGPWKDHKYKRIENGQYIYNDSSSSSASKPISKSEINSNEKRNESFTGNALYKTGKMGGPLKGVPYAQTAGGFYLYNNPNIRNGRGKYLVYKPDGSKLYINSLDEWKDLRNNKTAGSSSSNSSKKTKKATPAEQIEELKEDIGEIKDLELDLSDVAGYDALANRELERLEAEQRAKEEALKKKQDAKRIAENMKKQKEALRRKKQFENQNKVTNIMETARHSDYGYAIVHSAKGDTWKKHKYIRKEGNKYIYKEDVGDTNRGKASDLERARAIAGMTTGKKVGDTSRSLKNNSAGYAYDYSGNKDKSIKPQKIDDRSWKSLGVNSDIVEKLSDKNYVDTIDGIQYYLNPEKGETVYDEINKTFTLSPKYIGVREDGKTIFTSKLPKKKLTDKLGFDEKERLKKASRDQHASQKELTKSLQKNHKEDTPIMGTIWAIDSLEDKKRAQAEYDATPLGKAEKKVNEVKSDIKNTAKKATSTVKNTGKKVGSVLSNVVTRKTTLDASKDSSNSKVKEILDDITNKNKGSQKKKKVKHSSEGAYLAHSYRVIKNE